MASTFTTSFGIEKIGSGEQSGTWGTTTNHNLDLLDRIASYTTVALSGTTHTLTIREASPGSGTENLQDGMYRVIKFTGALGANNTVTIAPNTAKTYFIIENATTDSGSSGPYSVVLTQGSGANVTVQNGKNVIVYCDGAGSGAAVVDALADLQVGTVEVTGAAAIDGAATLGSTLTVTGASQFNSTVTVGVDDTGYDVKFFGATSGSYWLWDESADGVVQIGTLTIGVNDAGHDVKFFGDTANAYMLWDASADDLILAEPAKLGVGAAPNATFGSFIYAQGTPTANKPIIGAYSQGNSNTAGLGLFNDSGNRGIWTTGSVMRFTRTYEGNSTDDVVIDASGLVGFGTASPSEELHIFAAAPTIKLEDSDNNLSGYINGDNGNVLLQSHNANRDIIFGENAASGEIMRVLGLGRVGIGTSAPDSNHKLEVYSTGTTEVAIRSGNSSEAIINFGDVDSRLRGRIAYNNSSEYLAFWANAGEKMRIDSSGNLIVKPASSSQTISVEASGGGAQIEMQADGGTLTTVGSTNNVATAIQSNSQEYIRVLTDGKVGIGTSSPGYLLEVKADDTTTGGQLFINQAGTGDPGIRLATAATNYMIGVDNSESADTFKIDYGTTGVGAQTGIALNTSGQIGIRRAVPTCILDINGPGNTGDLIVRVADASPTQYLGVYNANTGANAPNSANATLTVRGMDSTVRAINAGGTVNASGADYAEYMFKADGCGTIAKGAICGVDADGKLTDQFDAAHSFVVKSTDPSYVGGDVWGIDSTDADGNQTMLEGDALEAARQKVDRIAFAGQVPCLVTGSAAVGDYIVPQRADDGGIEAVAVSSLSFDQYRAAVGKIWQLNNDNKHTISVKIG